MVGTGYGAAVTARRLGEAGVPTLMLEMGRLWDTTGSDGRVFCGMLDPDRRSSWFRTETQLPLASFLWVDSSTDIERYPGVLDRMSYDDMSVYVGRGVGGGSLVKGAMAVTPKRSYFTTILPSVYDLDYMQREETCEVTRSALASEVIFGNNHGKRSLDETYLAITDNPQRGYFAYDSAADEVRLHCSPEQGEPAIASARALFDEINRVAGTIYRSDLFGDTREFEDRFTYHPLGGLVLGEATDDYGRVPGHPGLYVTDGSLVPGSLGVNPFVTITALAERNIEHVLAADLS